MTLQVYLDGQLYVLYRGRFFAPDESFRASNGTRHPSDPAWVIDLLNGVETEEQPVRDEASGQQVVFATCSASAAAERGYELAVSESIGRAGRSDPVPVRALLDPEGRLREISYRLPRRSSVWSQTRFFQFGADWTPPEHYGISSLDAMIGMLPL